MSQDSNLVPIIFGISLSLHGRAILNAARSAVFDVIVYCVLGIRVSQIKSNNNKQWQTTVENNFIHFCCLKRKSWLFIYS